ncbi:MAG: sulfotransferase [Ornithinimicrobium sp.]
MSTTASERPTVLFLAGLGRSGTTLIERVLGETPGVTALGEVMHLWDRGLARGERCACGRLLLECPFWSAVGEAAFGGWRHVDTERMARLKERVDRTTRIPSIVARRPGSFAADVDEYVDHFVRLYRAAAQVAGGTSPVLVDSSKQASLAWCLARSSEVDLRVVHCVRDSRAVAHSWSKEVRRPEAVSSEHDLMPRYSAPLVATYWALHNVASELLGRQVPSIEVRYEDFMIDPVGRTRAMLALAGVDSSPEHVTSSAVDLGENHSCAGNPMRFKQGRIDLVVDERWRREQTTRDRRLMTALTAPMLRHYGYRSAPDA